MTPGNGLRNRLEGPPPKTFERLASPEVQDLVDDGLSWRVYNEMCTHLDNATPSGGNRGNIATMLQVLRADE